MKWQPVAPLYRGSLLCWRLCVLIAIMAIVIIGWLWHTDRASPLFFLVPPGFLLLADMIITRLDAWLYRRKYFGK